MYRFVDDRDVACAHVQAFETPSASGRYCLGGQFAHFPEVLEILPEYYPTLPLPER
jgi:nucleoside-diphosphate-sugar epimerase